MRLSVENLNGRIVRELSEEEALRCSAKRVTEWVPIDRSRLCDVDI